MKWFTIVIAGTLTLWAVCGLKVILTDVSEIPLFDVTIHLKDELQDTGVLRFLEFFTVHRNESSAWFMIALWLIVVQIFESRNKIWKEKQRATIEKYTRDVNRFLDYCGNRNITKELVIAYKAELLQKGYAARSINSMLSSINDFLCFIGKQEEKVKTLILQPQVFCSEERELSRREYVKLCQAAKQKKNERINLIMQTICSTGIRVSELRFITVEAIKHGEAQVNCQGKNRSVFIVKSLQKALLRFARECGIKSGAVFLTRSGKPVDRIMVWREMKSLCKDAGVSSKKVFPHNLRHLFARWIICIQIIPQTT